MEILSRNIQHTGEKILVKKSYWEDKSNENVVLLEQHHNRLYSDSIYVNHTYCICIKIFYSIVYIIKIVMT